MKSEARCGEVDLVVVGSVGLDTVATPRETRREVLGGAATYACAAASFFCRTGMVGIVGDDFPTQEERRLHHFGIDLGGLRHVAGSTFRWSGVYEADFMNRRTLDTDLGVFAGFAPDLPASYRNARCLLLGNIGPELQLRVLEQVAGNAFVAADTMDLWIHHALDPLREVIRRVSLLTLNDSEARLLTERHNLLECGEKLLEMGPQYVVVKKGEHGALLFSRDGIAILPAYPVRDVVDPTGAGDVFAGAALGVLAADANGFSEETLIRGLQYGSVVASFGVEAFGLEALEALDHMRIEDRWQGLRAMLHAIKR